MVRFTQMGDDDFTAVAFSSALPSSHSACDYCGVSGERGSNAELVRQIIRRLDAEPHSSAYLSDMYPTLEDLRKMSADEKMLIERIYENQPFASCKRGSITLERLKCMATFDCFSLSNGRGIGLYPNASYFNHSCEPNCTREATDDGTLYLSARRDIEAGEELCVSYVPLFRPREMRIAKLLREYGFRCQCPRCETPHLVCSVESCRHKMALFCAAGDDAPWQLDPSPEATNAHWLYNRPDDGKPRIWKCTVCGAGRRLVDVYGEIIALQRHYEELMELFRHQETELFKKEYKRIAPTATALLGEDNYFDRDLQLFISVTVDELRREASLKQQQQQQPQQPQQQESQS